METDSCNINPQTRTIHISDQYTQWLQTTQSLEDECITAALKTGVGEKNIYIKANTAAWFAHGTI